MNVLTPLTVLVVLLSHAALATPTVVRTRFGAFELIDPQGHGSVITPLTPTALGQTSGVLRYLAASEPAGALVFEAVGDNEGGLFAVPIAGGKPVRLGSSRGVDFDVELSPDGRWIALSDENRLRIVHVTLRPEDVRELTLVDPRPWKEQRFEQLAWQDGHVRFARSHVVPEGSHLLTISRIESVSMLGEWKVLVPSERVQDRPVAELDDGRVLFYREGIASTYDPRTRKVVSLGERFSVSAFGPVDGGYLVARGVSGVEHDVAFEVLGPSGTRSIMPTATVYLDPLVTADRKAFWVTVRRGGLWAVERIGLDGKARRIGAHAQPVELVARTSDDRVVGCRGDDIVVVGERVRVLATSRGLPSCTVRQVIDTAEGPLLAFDAKVDDGFRTTLVPLDGGAPVALEREVSWIGGVRDRFVVQSFADANATIVADGQTLVPWTSAGIRDAHLSPDGKTTVFRKGQGVDWFAVDAAGERRIGSGSRFIGMTDDRLVLHDGQTIAAHRFDGRDAKKPIVCLENAMYATDVAHRSARIAARQGDKIVSVTLDGSERLRPRVLGESFWGQVELDRVHERVVFERRAPLHELVAVPIDGSAAPTVIAHPAPELHDVEMTNSGNAVLVYATSHTAVPHPYRWDYVATNGSGERVASPVAMPPQGPPPLDMFGRETREELVPYGR